MSQKKRLTILEFSRLTGIKRENLRFYDRIGLLSPEARGENGYRYYTRRQLSSAYLIGTLRGLGVGLEDIRQYSDGRTPVKMLSLFEKQEAYIQAELAKLRETSEIMEQYAGMAREALRHEPGALLLEERKRERIFLCPPAPAGTSEEESGIAAYEYANGQGVNLGYPPGVLISHTALASGDTSWSYRYYFRTGKKGNAWKPAGRCAVAYGRGDPQQSEALYWSLLDFIRAQGLEAAGGVYGEFLLDELAVQEPEEYCIRLEAPVTPAVGG